MIEKYESNAEKTGWTFIQINQSLAVQLHNSSRKSFRVKGTINSIQFAGIALVPIGNGDYILPLNATLRKSLKIRKGDAVNVTLEIDTKPYKIDNDFLNCLQDDAIAYSFFNSLPKSHQNYFSKWIESAKTIETKATRIAQSIKALSIKRGYSEMLRSQKSK